MLEQIEKTMYKVAIYIRLSKEDVDRGYDDSENIKKLVKEFLELKELTLEVMKVIINRIEIHQDKQVDLYFNFKQLNNITQNCLLWHQPEAISMSDRVIVLSHRPATVRKIYTVDFEMENRTPLNCRENPKFSKYFNLMWKELGNKTI